MRVLTLNIWQEQGPWRKRLELIANNVAALDLDVICLQEVREVKPDVPNQAGLLAALLGLAHWTFQPVQEWGGGVEGLAILSRLPLVRRDATELPSLSPATRRYCLGAELALPRDERLWVFTTHLAYRPNDGVIREQQVLALDRFVAHCRQDCCSIICGDFNATADTDEIRYLRGLTTLDGQRTFYQDAYSACHPDGAGITWSASNPYTESLGWLGRDRRLDYVFVTPERRDGQGRIRSCDVVFDQPGTDGIYCSDHYGVVASVDLRAGTPGL
jgi:endonuclease/exonuclease/phosphatase family metal-dependent hydrolase